MCIFDVVLNWSFTSLCVDAIFLDIKLMIQEKRNKPSLHTMVDKESNVIAILLCCWWGFFHIIKDPHNSMLGALFTNMIWLRSGEE